VVYTRPCPQTHLLKKATDVFLIKAYRTKSLTWLRKEILCVLPEVKQEMESC